MRPIFALDTSGHLVSTIIDSDAQALPVQIGMKFEFAEPYETPWGQVPTGVVAEVVEVVDVTGELDLEVREKIPALFFWSNLLTLLPFMSDDLTRCLHLLS